MAQSVVKALEEKKIRMEWKKGTPQLPKAYKIQSQPLAIQRRPQKRNYEKFFWNDALSILLGIIA